MAPGHVVRFGSRIACASFQTGRTGRIRNKARRNKGYHHVIANRSRRQEPRWWWKRRPRRRSPPPDTISPQFTYCPSTHTTHRITSSSTKVTWSDPRATDNRGTPTITFGPSWEIQTPKMSFFLKVLCMTWLLSMCCKANSETELLGKQALREHLLSSYYKTMASEEPLSLHYGICPVKVVEVDVKRGLVTVDLWLKHHWYDSRLAWDPAVYDSKIMFMKSDEVYVPEMALMNGVMTSTVPETLVVVNPFGGMIYFPAVRAEIYCRLPSLPFTDVICPIVIGPWSHDTRQTVLETFDPVVETAFIQNTGVCSIGDSWAEIQESSYDCCPGIQFISMTLYLRINCTEFEPIAPVAESLKSAHEKVLPESTNEWSLPIVLAPYLVLLIFLLPHRATDRVFLGTIVFVALFLVWTSTELSPEERQFLRLSTILTLSATFASLVPCRVTSTVEPATQIREYGPKQSWCKNRVALMIDLMLFVAVAVVLGISTAGTFA